MHVFALSTPTVSINVNKRYYVSVNKRISERTGAYFPVPNFLLWKCVKMIKVRSRLTTGMEDSKDDEKGARYQRGREHCSAHYTRRQLALHSSVLPATTAPGRSTASLTRSRTHSWLHGRTSQYIPSSSPNLQLRVCSQITPAYA